MPAIDYTEHELSTIHRTCGRCGEKKTLGDFCKDKSHASGRNTVCKVCESARRLTYKRLDVADYIIRADKELEEFKKRIEEMAATTPLTERDWYRICKYFGSCSICGEGDIEAKMYFVPFKKDGAYANHNIIPVCLSCRTLFDGTIIGNNPFYLKYKRIRRKYRNKELKDDKYLNNILNIISYLEGVISNGKG